MTRWRRVVVAVFSLLLLLALRLQSGVFPVIKGIRTFAGYSPIENEDEVTSFHEDGTPLILFSKFAMKSDEELLNNTWMAPLKELSRRVNTDNQVTLVFSTSSYTESMLNWLIAAQVRCEPPITNVIVICYDRELFNILNPRNIPSVYIDSNSLLDTKKFLKKFKTYVRMLRLVTVRFMNSWGYDVVQIDTDAIVLKNPQELFAQHQESDIVSAAGLFPGKELRRWGVAVCTGFILFRSTPRTGNVAIMAS